MNEARKNWASLLFLCLLAGLCWGQDEDKTLFSQDEGSFRRLATAKADRDAFLPQYADFVRPLPGFREIRDSNTNRQVGMSHAAQYGIPQETFQRELDRNGDTNLDSRELESYLTLKDWQNQNLPSAWFYSLDRQRPYGVLTQEELAAESRDIRREEAVAYWIPEESFVRIDENKDRVLSRSELEKHELITLKDWRKSYLSPHRFVALDQPPETDPFVGLLSRAELNMDPLQGEAVLCEQGEAEIQKRCSGIPGQKEKSQALQRMGYKDLARAQCVMDKRLSEDGGNGAFPPRTKTYIQLRNGKAIFREVDLGTYNYLRMRDLEADTSLDLYIGLAVLVGLVAVATSLVSITSR